MLVVLRDGGSGVDVGERGHQLTRVIENSAAKLVFRPGGDGPVALRQIAKAGEGLVAVTARVEEVDRLAARDAVASGGHIDLDLVLGYQQMDQSLYQHYHLHLVECQLVSLVLVAVPVYLLVLLQDLERLLFALRWVKTCLFLPFIFSSFTVLTVL